MDETAQQQGGNAVAVVVGFGSIGQGVLPLILRHIGITPDRVTIVTADDEGRREVAEYGVRFIGHPVTRENHVEVLGRGDFLLNLSVDVFSIALIKLAYEKGALYLDTILKRNIEKVTEGLFFNPSVTLRHPSSSSGSWYGSSPPVAIRAASPRRSADQHGPT